MAVQRHLYLAHTPPSYSYTAPLGVQVYIHNTSKTSQTAPDMFYVFSSILMNDWFWLNQSQS